MIRGAVDAESIAQEEPPLDAGTRFGRYEVVRHLGSGGFGNVYEALHRELGKRVALKVLRREYALHPTVRARFTREGQAASRLRHPNVVDVTDVGVFDGQPYLVMELLEGETLRDRAAREGAMAPDHVVDLMLPVLDAIGEAHDLGIVHRDLKPENIFLSRAGSRPVVPKVLDFGVVKLDADRPGSMLTGSGILLGTPSYMSPEQARGVRDVDGRSDQFSLALIVYECLEGRRAFDGEGVLATLQRVAHDEPAPLRAALPEGLRAAVARAMQKDPALRFATVRDFAAALLPFASEPVRAQWSALRGAAPLDPSPPVRVLSGPRTLQGRVRAAPSTRSARVGAWVAVALLGVGATLSAWRWRYGGQPVPLPTHTIVRAVAPAASQPAARAPLEATRDAIVAPPVAPPPAGPARVAPSAARVAPTPQRAARRAAADAGARARRVGVNGAVIED